jgi:PRC-barrel domain
MPVSFLLTGTVAGDSRSTDINDGETSMRSYLLTAGILAASVCALPAATPLAEDIHQPWAATSTSRDPQYSEDTWRSILLSHNVQGALGKEVRSGTGENLGRIVDVLVDQDGQVRAAVIDFGGFLGVGSRKIVVDWRALHFAPADQPDRISIDLTRDQVSAAPEYKAGQPVVVLGSTAVPE